MLTAIRRIWNPAAFHYHNRLARPANRFEGWYIKCVDSQGRQPMAFIPGVFLGKDRHAFVQVLDGRRGLAWYHRYPLEAFRAAPGEFDVHVGPNHFHRGGFSVDIDAPDADPPQRLTGQLALGGWRPWPVTTLKPGCMGPYAFFPMECYHGILSLDHGLDGTLNLDGESTNYAGGRGYIEKDWGSNFPAAYVWVQSNHFERPGICLTASVAKIPWFTGAFRGFLAGFLIDDTFHAFATWNGGKVRALAITGTHLHLTLENRTHRLEVDAEKRDGALLKAPYEHDMIERVAETMTSVVDVRFGPKDASPHFEGRGHHACLELQGKLDDILGSDR